MKKFIPIKWLINYSNTNRTVAQKKQPTLLSGVLLLSGKHRKD